VAPTFRLATDGDADAVADLIELAYRGPSAASAWTTEADILTGPRTSRGQVARLLARPDFHFVLADVDGRLSASAALERAGDDAYFGMFAVDPARQAAGLGRALLAECERFAVELWTARRMTMRVISLRHELIAWYERRGYALTGEREPFPFDQAHGALRTDFDLVQLAKELAPGPLPRSS